MFSLETRRWAPDAEARASVPTAAGADPTLMQMVELAGLLGDEATLAERTTEYMCSGSRPARRARKRGRPAGSCEAAYGPGSGCHGMCLLARVCCPFSSTPPRPRRADMAREVGEDERRERFSFALARTLDLGPERLQELMYSQVGGREWTSLH